MPKFRFVVDRVACGTPVPVRLIVCGLPLALSKMDIDPLKFPVVVGVKVTLIVHDALGGSETGAIGQLLVSENGEGGFDTAILLIRRPAAPVFLRRADLKVLVVPTA